MQHVSQPCISVSCFKHCLPYVSLIPVHLVVLTFDLRGDAVLWPVSGEDHCSQVSPSRVSTQVQTTETDQIRDFIKHKLQHRGFMMEMVTFGLCVNERIRDRTNCINNMIQNNLNSNWVMVTGENKQRYLMWEYCWMTDTTLLRTWDTIRSMLPEKEK